jgi:hypothetical protein
MYHTSAALQNILNFKLEKASSSQDSVITLDLGLRYWTVAVLVTNKKYVHDEIKRNSGNGRS